jgi:hypothetical protein
MHITRLFLLFILSILSFTITGKAQEMIIDSDVTFNEAIAGKEAPKEITAALVLLNVEYYSFDGKLHRGQLVVHKDLEKDLREIFAMIKEKKFPVEKVIPVNKYKWDDDLSMKDNNTSAFNYRVVAGTKKLSNHAAGRAVDINPLLNPMIKNGKASPGGAQYKPGVKGTITADSFIVEEFLKRGWEWGGNWKNYKDYQHFDKKK